MEIHWLKDVRTLYVHTHTHILEFVFSYIFCYSCASVVGMKLSLETRFAEGPLKWQPEVVRDHTESFWRPIGWFVVIEFRLALNVACNCIGLINNPVRFFLLFDCSETTAIMVASLLWHWTVEISVLKQLDLFLKNVFVYFPHVWEIFLQENIVNIRTLILMQQFELSSLYQIKWRHLLPTILVVIVVIPAAHMCKM